MRNIYKVTDACIGETKKGHKVYKVQLNNSIWATRLIPFDSLKHKHDTLYYRYKENNNLDFLLGKYISVGVSKTQYGAEFSVISSFDVIQDFKDLLDKSKGKAFGTDIDIYGFLKAKYYSINQDNSITLKAPYDNLDIISTSNYTLCYPNNLKDDVLTIYNIDAIFDKFYKDKIIKSIKGEEESVYSSGPWLIGISTTRYEEDRKSIQKRETRTFTKVLEVGDRLTEEQYNYILNHSELCSPKLVWMKEIHEF